MRLARSTLHTQLCSISNTQIYLHILQTSNMIAGRFEFQPVLNCILRHTAPCSLVDTNEITVKPAISDIQTEDVDILTEKCCYVSSQAGLQSATIHKQTIFTHTKVKTAFLTHPESVSPFLFRGNVCKQYRIDFFQALMYLPHHSSLMFVKDDLLVERVHSYG